MQRTLAVLLTGVGLALAAVGLFRFVDRHTHTGARPVVVGPATYSRHLTAGVWDMYGKVGTGPFGTPLLFSTTITAPDGRHLTLSAPSYINVARADGEGFSESVSARISAAGVYQIQVAPPAGSRLATVLAPAPGVVFPWGIVAIDGAVLLSLGAGWAALDARRRRQVDQLEAMYRSPDPVGSNGHAALSPDGARDGGSTAARP